MSENCDVNLFPIYGQFFTIRKPYSGRIICNTNVFINSTILSESNVIRTYNHFG